VGKNRQAKFRKLREGPLGSSPLAGRPNRGDQDDDGEDTETDTEREIQRRGRSRVRRSDKEENLALAVAVLDNPERDYSVVQKLVGNGKFDSFNHSVVEGWKYWATMQSASDKFTTFDHGHNDLVLAVDFNFYGNRMVTAGSDHKLKVWDKKEDGQWALVDTWRAHDAEVVDVKWNGPFSGSIIGSIGEDGQFKLWEEDVLQAPHSGRRFQRIMIIKSETKIPFCSLDFKNLHMETYVALITRDGYLSVLEPNDHDNLGGEWSNMVQKYITSTPSRQEETGFRVSWHKEKVPCWTAVEAGLKRDSLALAVAAMDKVVILRTNPSRQFYEAAHLHGARNIIRDVAWANGAMRGFDLIATGSKDGMVRIYELHTVAEHQPPVTAVEEAGGKSAKGAVSGIGAGLMGKEKDKENGHANEIKWGEGMVKHDVKKVAELTEHRGSVWRVAFSQLGKWLFLSNQVVTNFW
jgi:nucleoporin SEH1